MNVKMASAPARTPVNQTRRANVPARAPQQQAPARKAPSTIREQLEGESFRLALTKILPKHLTADRFVKVAIMAMTRNPMLAECDRHSFFLALMQLSQWGLEPDGRRAHLIPFRNRKRGIVECQPIIDYKGLVELVTNTSVVSYVHADVVCEHDEFEFDKGELLHHRIDFRRPRGNVFAAYAICRFKDRSEKAVVMDYDEIEAIRARSKSPEEGPWVTDWREMAKKTVFRRLSKWLPLSAELRDAVDSDEEALEARRFDAARPVFDASSFLPEGAPEIPQAKLPPLAPEPDIGEPQKEKERQPDPVPASPGPETEPPPAPGPDAPSSGQVDDPDGPVIDAEIPPLTEHQAQLDALLAEHGFSFDLLQSWAVETNWEPGCDSWGSIFDVPDRSARRLVQAKSGLVTTLERRRNNQLQPAEAAAA